MLTADTVHLPTRVNAQAECRPFGSADDWQQSLDLEIRSFTDAVHDPDHAKFAERRTHANRRLVADGHGRWFGAFLDGRLVAQLGLVDAGHGLARFQSVATDPAFLRQGLAGTLIHHAGRWGLEVLGAQTLVIVADPAYFAIDLYRNVGFVAAETQLTVERAPTA